MYRKTGVLPALLAPALETSQVPKVFLERQGSELKEEKKEVPRNLGGREESPAPALFHLPLSPNGLGSIDRRQNIVPIFILMVAIPGRATVLSGLLRDNQVSGPKGKASNSQGRDSRGGKSSRGLCTGGHAQNAPVLLRAKRPGVVLLPHIVEGAVEDDIGGEALLDAGNRRLLVSLAGDREFIRLTLRRPASLRHDRGLTTGSLGDLLHPVRHKLPRFLGRRVAIEESVAVDGAKVGGGAEFWMGFHGHHRIDRDDGAVVPSGFENGSGLTNSSGDLTNRSAAVVD